MIRIALIGCGYWGNTVIKAILRISGIELVAVYDKDPKQLEQVRLAYGDSFSYAGNYQELLDDASIDAFALTVSTGAHFELAEKALAAKKHIFIEKPFTETLTQAERLYELAKEKDCIIHVDHIMLYNPAIRKMKELLKKESLGEIRYMEMRRTSFGGARADVSVLQDLTIHDLSIIDYLTDGEKPVSVHSIGEKLAYSHTSVAFMLLKYRGFSVELTSSWVSPVIERRICLGGTDKTLVFDEIISADKLVVYNNNDPDDQHIIQLEAGNALDNSLEHFRECAEAGIDSLTDGTSAIRIMKILTEV